MVQLFCLVRRERAAKVDRRKRRSQLITIGIIAAAAAGLAYGVYSYALNPPPEAGFGALNSQHIHSAFKLFINNQTVDFSQPKYQVKSQLVHFENGDGDTIHTHATRVNIGYLFQSLGIQFTSECLTMDNGEKYCNDGNNTLKLYINDVRNNMYGKYEMKDNDRIVLSYGSESQEQIDAQLKIVDDMAIKN